MDIGELRQKLVLDLERLRSPYGYLRAGWPHFKTYFSRDAFLSAWQLLGYDPGIAFGTLRFATHFQGKVSRPMTEEEPGKMPHQVFLTGLDRIPVLNRIFWGLRYYGSVDATPLFLILLTDYARYNAKEARGFLEEFEANVRAAFDWILNRLDRDGWLVYRKHYAFGLTHQGWRDGWRNRIKLPVPVALADVQAYAYAAMAAGIWLFRNVYDDMTYAMRLAHAAGDLAGRFHAAFRWPEEDYYYFALAGEELRPVRRITPEPAMAIFSGIIPDELIPAVVRRAFQPDLATPFGIRTLSARDPLFRSDSYFLGSVWPWINWLIWLGLVRYGFGDEARATHRMMLDAALALGGAPEVYEVTAPDDGTLEKLRVIPDVNPVQAWSVGALLAMME